MSSFSTVLPVETRSTLKSSSSLAREVPDFRPVERDLHDTSKRIVESMPDSRITFYSNLSGFEKRVVKKEIGYFTQAAGRVGYLLLLPKRPAVWLDEQMKQCFRIPLRVSQSIFQQRTIFIATLNRSEGRLTLDDCWEWKGQSMIGKPFTKRWELVRDFFSAEFKEDERLQRGLQIEPAVWYPLLEFESLCSTGALDWIHWQPEHTASKRLRIELKERMDAQTTPLAQTSHKTSQKESRPPQPSAETATLTARAVANPDMPDTYTLFTAENTEKGTAAVQRFTLSKQLRDVLAQKEQKEVFVEVEWNTEFEKWQITGVAAQQAAASPESQWARFFHSNGRE